MKLWIAVEVFGLIVGDVHVFKTPEEADKWFEKYTGLPYDRFYMDGELGEGANEDYDQTQIFEVEIDIP